MKNPKWRINFRILKNSQFSFKFNSYINKRICWKDKFGTPRVEILPKYLFSWLWFQLDIIQRNDRDFEWFLWVTKFCNNDIDKAIENWPWGSMMKMEILFQEILV